MCSGLKWLRKEDATPGLPFLACQLDLHVSRYYDTGDPHDRGEDGLLIHPMESLP